MRGLVVALLAASAAAQEAPLRWAAVELGDRPGAFAPEVVSTGSGVCLTWLEPAGERRGRRRPLALRLSRYGEESFSAPVTVTEGTALFANWADFATSCETVDGSLYTNWLLRGGRGTYGIVLARRAVGADEFTELGHPHRVGIRGEHGFVSMVPEGPGVRLFWLDGRHYGDEQRMELRTALVAGDELGPEQVLDPDVCTCCQTGAAIAASGPLVVYRGHADGEVRDVEIVRRVGDGWSRPVRVAADDWVIAGCPVNGPAVSASGAAVTVAWYTGAQGGAGVKAAFSRDGGATFDPPLWVDRGDTLGRVDLVATRRGALLCWLTRGGDGTAAVRIQEIGPKGELGPAQDVAEVAATRGAGFPRLAEVEGGALLVWTEPGADSRLRAVRIRLP